MDSTRKTALVAGVFFLLTFVTSVPALGLYGPVLNDANYVLGGGADSRIFAGAFLEVLLAASGIGTAVTLFPVLKRQNEGMAIGYVAARILESAIIVVGIIGVLSVVTMRQDFAASAGAGGASYVITAKALVAIHKWSFLLGPGFFPGAENGLLLGYLMYRTGLVPRRMAVLGMVAGALASISAVLELFGVYSQTGRWAVLLVGLEALWELFLGIWFTFKGFNPSPILAESAAPSAAGVA